ncbi:non-hydrolyzing UDP-N-acetylglucosamine 2-epimerase [Photobacterium leiognathi]|uniref:non-hydrolyzing UDP-N-acetylglucosamine 2-epimerase n=1 Tax=Photobacterium leiognathi TaxID=553611 RepID=UPI00298230F2|nr:UDP-N-acetylglucosamine 2-epimerase (non-hydrolyzing) [Photobacterium leiognathi]
MIKVLTVIGARPQFIKAAAVSKEISKNTTIEEVIVHTGQHFDKNMSDIFFSELGIPAPKYQLNISSLSHGAMTGRMLESIEEVILIEKPNFLLVYGDTNSTLAGALAAKKLHVKVIHIESGLRSFNDKMPEEINRKLTDKISDILFCSSETSIKQLKKEGIVKGVFNSGDVMQDAVELFSKYTNKQKEKEKDNYILATIHRAENTDNKKILSEIFIALNKINENKKVVMPIHPRTRKIVDDLGIEVNFELKEPVGYIEMLGLIGNSDLVITDSGGLQKEAYFKNKNCVVVRNETEWDELVECGYNKLVGTNKENIIKAVFTEFEKITNFNIYGDGNASKLIIKKIIEESNC